MAKIQNKKMASAQYSSRKKAKDKIEAQENASWKAWRANNPPVSAKTRRENAQDVAKRMEAAKSKRSKNDKPKLKKIKKYK